MTLHGSSDPRASALLEVRSLRSSLAGPFDLALDRGECIAITGASGAGKSLFLRMIADLDPNDGEVTLNGRDRRSWTAPEWRRQVIYHAAEPGWWAERVAEHFPAAALSRARELVPLLDLSLDLLGAPVARLSTGERQRMALIRAVVAEPPVLLLDEPTGSLDQNSVLLVEELLADRLAGDTAVVMTTHDLSQAQRIGTRHLRMAGRRLVAA
ncbi:MAG TPA: ABC transporter ATP-binding protein [Acetobacteraceae bacterium]